jgi:hypothetical protein
MLTTSRRLAGLSEWLKEPATASAMTENRQQSRDRVKSIALADEINSAAATSGCSTVNLQ